MRLDAFLAEKGLVKSRTRAAEMIKNGLVTVNGKTAAKPSLEVDEGDEISVKDEENTFVGRGGLKLEGALKEFSLDVGGKICADIGASTGGFTDCLLSHGAKHVYAVDAGHGQLDEKLISDSRVTNLEGINARYMTDDTLPEKCTVAVMDLSFISQTLVLPALTKIITPDADVVTLIKPQFECGRAALSKNGIVKDKKQHIMAIRSVTSAAVSCGLMPQKIALSPIKGGDGNREFLLYAKYGGHSLVTEDDIRRVTDE